MVGRSKYKSVETRVETAWIQLLKHTNHCFQVLFSISTCAATARQTEHPELDTLGDCKVYGGVDDPA